MPSEAAEARHSPARAGRGRRASFPPPSASTPASSARVPGNTPTGCTTDAADRAVAATAPPIVQVDQANDCVALLDPLRELGADLQKGEVEDLLVVQARRYDIGGCYPR